MSKKRLNNPNRNALGQTVQMYDPEFYMPLVCAHLERSASLKKACAEVGGPSTCVVIKWVNRDDKYRQMYEEARKIGYTHLADELLEIADTQVAEEVDDEGNTVKRRFDQIDTQMTKFRIDTRKWILAKMLPKIYGDKVTTEHVGHNGGPMQIAAMDFKGLTTDELSVLQKLLAKAA